MADRFPEAELVLDNELLFDDSPRRSFMRRSDEQLEQIVREGEVLAGKYRVERIPGRSGLGVVVQVRHMELGQEVTLKFLVPDACAYPEFVQRFVREARAAVKIQGEHVARVTDVGRLESGAPYMVRELLRGPDLAEVIKVRGSLPVSEAVDYVVQACEGVAEGHALGVVHRNIKPTSLVVTRRSDGTPLVKVVDFAAAESLHVDPFTERAVSLVGTSAIMASLPYLSPEQIRDPLDVDVRSDIYSLGAVLFELLAGTPIYAADSAPALLAMVAADPAPPLRSLRPDAPGELDHVVLRCVSKNRAIRYASLAELVLALRPFASDDVATSIERVVRLAKRSTRPTDAVHSSAPVQLSAPGTLPGSPAPPFMPAPSAAPPAVQQRGPSGTMLLNTTDKVRQSFAQPGNEDVTAISPYARYSEPVVITQPLETTPLVQAQAEPPIMLERSAQRSAPPPLRPSAPAPRASVPPPRASVPPPLRTSAPPLPQTLVSEVPAPAAPTPSSMPITPPPARPSMSGVSRSWVVPDVPEDQLFTRKRLIAVGAIAACATLGAVFAFRGRAPAPQPVAAAPKLARPPAAAPPPPVAEPTPPPAEPVASASAAPAASGAPATSPPAVAAAAPVPAPAPAPPVAAAPPKPAAPPAAQLAVATLRRPVPAKPKPAENYWESSSAPSPEKVARARPTTTGADLFDDPR